LVKLGYFPDGSGLGTALQESLENGYKADVSIHPDFRKELLALLSTYYEDLLDLKGVS